MISSPEKATDGSYIDDRTLPVGETATDGQYIEGGGAEPQAANFSPEIEAEVAQNRDESQAHLSSS